MMRRRRTRLAIGLAVAAGLAVLAAANVHLVYVALLTQPDCVPHAGDGGERREGHPFRAAVSSCTPEQANSEASAPLEGQRQVVN